MSVQQRACARSSQRDSVLDVTSKGNPSVSLSLVSGSGFGLSSMASQRLSSADDGKAKVNDVNGGLSLLVAVENESLTSR